MTFDAPLDAFFRNPAPSALTGKARTWRRTMVAIDHGSRCRPSAFDRRLTEKAGA
jgi:hypothetical protein